MLNFASCEPAAAGLEALLAGRADLAARRLGVGAGGGQSDEARLKKAARDFASIFYSIAFKEMQKSARIPGAEGEEADEDPQEGGPVAEGAQDFVAMFLPRAVAGDGADPLARYIYHSLKERYGGALDEES